MVIGEKESIERRREIKKNKTVRKERDRGIGEVTKIKTSQYIERGVNQTRFCQA